ncbi:hypothetical protein Hdeb2414_s0112g00798481 [Helianthus debilis subsp. tardiflorus]
MEDEGRKSQLKEGSSVLKRPHDDDDEEDLPNSAAAASASGTKAEVKAKRPSVDPKPFRPSVETGWTWLPFRQPPYNYLEPAGSSLSYLECCYLFALVCISSKFNHPSLFFLQLKTIQRDG